MQQIQYPPPPHPPITRFSLTMKNLFPNDFMLSIFVFFYHLFIQQALEMAPSLAAWFIDHILLNSCWPPSDWLIMDTQLLTAVRQ